MVHTLENLCIQTIGVNLHQINRSRLYTAGAHKERILRWLVCKDKLTRTYVPHVTYNLFSDQLRHVTFFSSTQITDAFITQLAQSGCKLSTISMTDCPNITDKGLARLFEADECVLERLELRKMVAITGECLSGIRSTNLTSVCLRKCGKLTNDGLSDLVRNNPGITQLDITACSSLTEDVIRDITESLAATLESLDASDVYCITDTALGYIASKCPNIKVLKLHGDHKVSDSGLKLVFESCPRLEEIDLSFIQFKPWSCLRYLPAHSIRKLTLCGVQIDSAAALQQGLHRVTHSIRNLNVTGVPAFSEDKLNTVMDAVSGTLTHLDISGCQVNLPAGITDRGLAVIANACQHLTFIGLRMLSEVTGDGLLPLFRQPEKAQQLQGLMFTACKKFNADLVYSISLHCCNLSFIDLSGVSGLTDDHVCTLVAASPGLQHIGLKGAKLVSDVGVCSISRHCGATLSSLVISGCHLITDLSILALANTCHHLRELYSSGCSRVTRPALNYLQDVTLDRLLIYHKQPNVHEESVVMGRNLDTGHFERLGDRRLPQPVPH